MVETNLTINIYYPPTCKRTIYITVTNLNSIPTGSCKQLYKQLSSDSGLTASVYSEFSCEAMHMSVYADLNGFSDKNTISVTPLIVCHVNFNPPFPLYTKCAVEDFKNHLVKLYLSKISINESRLMEKS